MTHVARAIETGDTRGIMKALVDADSGEILGAAIVGTEGGEIMSVLQMAMLGGITYQVIADMVFAHPLHTKQRFVYLFSSLSPRFSKEFLNSFDTLFFINMENINLLKNLFRTRNCILTMHLFEETSFTENCLAKLFLFESVSLME